MREETPITFVVGPGYEEAITKFPLQPATPMIRYATASWDNTAKMWDAAMQPGP